MILKDCEVIEIIPVSTQVAYEPWHPMINAVDLKHIGKLGEEAGELCSVAARCVIQGMDSCEPVTKKVNRRWLEEEIADVEANIELAKKHFNLNREFIQERAEIKMSKLETWHRMA